MKEEKERSNGRRAKCGRNKRLKKTVKLTYVASGK